MIKCKNCKHFKESEIGGQTYYECLKIWNVEIHDKDFEHLCNQYETKVSGVETSHDKALNLADVNQRSELLKAFLDFQQNKYPKPYDTSISEQIADFEAFNCG